jgi:protein-S-isoprenylcysteine O-methyltransferase Ste14
MTKTEYILPQEYDGQRKQPKLNGWLAATLIIAVLIVTQVLPRGGNLLLRGAGVLALLLAGVFIFTPFYHVSKYGGAPDDRTYMETRVVVDRGLYAVTRHPQYLGYILLACGFALLSQHWITALLAGAGTTFFYLQAVREESYCLAQLGEPYARYLRRVPRFNIVLGVIRLLAA